MPPPVRHVLIGLVILALQWLILGRLRLWGAYPDAVLLYVAWMALQYGRLFGMFSGFFFGLAMDIIYGTWGIQAFVKTLVGFVIGQFPARERETLLIQPQQAFVGTLALALIHNGLLVIFFALQFGTRNTFLIVVLWVGSALYTSFLGTLAAMFAMSR